MGWARVFGSCPSPGEGRRHAGHPGICRCGPPRGTPLGHSCWGVRRRASPHRGSHTAVRAPGRASVHPSQFPRCPRQRAKRQIQWGAMLPTDPALRATVGHPGGPRGDRMRQGGNEPQTHVVTDAGRPCRTSHYGATATDSAPCVPQVALCHEGHGLPDSSKAERPPHTHARPRRPLRGRGSGPRRRGTHP